MPLLISSFKKGMANFYEDVRSTCENLAVTVKGIFQVKAACLLVNQNQKFFLVHRKPFQLICLLQTFCKK